MKTLRQAVRRVWQAPGLVALVVALHLLVAAVLGSGVRTAVGNSLGIFSVITDGHLLASVFELFTAHPGLLAAYRSTLAGSAVAGLALWTVLAPAVIQRLRAPRPASQLASATLKSLPGVMITTLWNWVPRAVLLTITGFATAKLMASGIWGLVGLIVMATVLATCTCALDLARCRVVLRDASGTHFMTAWNGYREALRRPNVLLPSMSLSFAKWACSLGMLALAIDRAGHPVTIWGVRGLAVFGLALGLARVAVAVESTR